jgi:hypothetical protein
MPYWVMTERSLYLREQAVKCRWHADHLIDLQTMAALRKLALEYEVQAGDIDSNDEAAP